MIQVKIEMGIKRLKWTEQMNIDCLNCKRKAQELIASENPPVNENGRRKGYIKVMKELWEAKGYEKLGLTSQNLRDQAPILEKIISDTSGQSRSNRTDVITGSKSRELGETGVQNRYSTISRTMAAIDTTTEHIDLTHANLHETVGDFNEDDNEELQYEGLPNETIDYQRENTSAQYLPEYNRIDIPASIKWGKSDNGFPILIRTSTIINAYDEIILWKKNVFLVLYGKIGREFIEQLTIHINQWNNKHIALKAFFVLLAVGLQKPGLKSKAKDHCLKNRLLLWKNGEIDTLLNEGRIIQSRIGKGKKSVLPNKAKVFAKLVMEGQINSAMCFLNDDISGDVLPLTDDGMLQLQERHPEVQQAILKVLLHGPVQDIPDSLFLEINGEMICDAALKTKGLGGCPVLMQMV